MIYLLALLLASGAQASNKVGNGGNVVSCKAKAAAPQTVRLLDFYENELLPASAKGTDPVAYAEKELDKLAPVASSLESLYRRRLKEIMGEIDFKPKVTLTSLDDSKHLFKPSDKNCSVTQIAIRRKNPVGDEKRFLIRKDLWEKLDTANQAGLLLHEIIYEHLSKLGEEDSIKARKLNAMIFSPELEKKKFWGTVKEMRISIYP